MGWKLRGANPRIQIARKVSLLLVSPKKGLLSSEHSLPLRLIVQRVSSFPFITQIMANNGRESTGLRVLLHLHGVDLGVDLQRD